MRMYGTQWRLMSLERWYEPCSTNKPRVDGFQLQNLSRRVGQAATAAMTENNRQLPCNTTGICGQTLAARIVQIFCNNSVTRHLCPVQQDIAFEDMRPIASQHGLREGGWGDMPLQWHGTGAKSENLCKKGTRKMLLFLFCLVLCCLCCWVCVWVWVVDCCSFTDFCGVGKSWLVVSGL